MREITYHIDLRGETCPYPTIRGIEALDELKNGEILEIVTDCAQTLHTIPIDVASRGHVLLETIREGKEIHFIIQKCC